MNYTARIVACCLVVFAVAGWTFYGLDSVDSYVLAWKRLLFSLLAAMVCGFAGWRIGKAFDEAKFYAEKDSLTGLYSRRVVSGFFPQYAEKIRQQGKNLSVCIVDIDHFKQINEEYGHEFGDQLIRLLAGIIVKRINPGDLAARWGDNEFLILAGCRNQQDVLLFLEQIEQDLERLSDHLCRPLSVSAGYSFYPEEAADLEGLLRLANYHMNDQKAIKRFKKKKKMV